jgi:hypothetical protein
LRKLIAGTCLVFSFLSFNAIAQENTELMAKGLWKDSATGLVWDRCVAGQIWDGVTCTGNATLVRWDGARSLAASVRTGGFSDWRLPTIEELYTIRRCSNGFSADDIDQIEPHQGGPVTVSRQCKPGSQSPTIDATVFPNTPPKDFWTGSPPKKPGNRDYSVVRFFIPDDYYNSLNYVRVVRSASEVDTRILASIFDEQLRPARKILLEEERKKAEKQRIEAEKQRIDNENYEKRQQAESRAFNSILNNNDPQFMYLSAGKFERNGDSYKAKQIYERIVDKFPSSSWAVKANDQLLQRQRVDSVNSAARESENAANERAYKACRIEVDSCYSRNGRNCYRDCDSLLR